MQYELAIENYKGPIETLLDLIVEKKMEITMVSLAEVTSDFLKFVEALEKNEKYRVLVADFLVIASKLIFIKSKVLIPNLELTEEEEEDIKNLESRLKLYKELKGAEENILKLWGKIPKIGHREFLMSSEKIFFPPQKITVDDLRDSIKKIYGELEKIYTPIEKIERKVISLKQKIQEVLLRISSEPTSFNGIHGGKSKGEVVVLFLAILHLIKDQLLSAEQDKHFSDILVAKTSETK